MKIMTSCFSNTESVKYGRRQGRGYFRFIDTVETANSGISFAHVFWPEFAVCWNLNNKLQISVIYRRNLQFKLQITAKFTEI